MLFFVVNNGYSVRMDDIDIKRIIRYKIKFYQIVDTVFFGMRK